MAPTQAAGNQGKGAMPKFRLMVSDADKKLVEVASFWERLSKKTGRPFLSGTAKSTFTVNEGEWLQIFPVTRKPK